MSNATPNSDFETSLAELEKIVNQLETGDLSLEESLAAFEHGVKLTQTCQQTLNTAEQKVQQLVAAKGDLELSPLSNNEE